MQIKQSELLCTYSFCKDLLESLVLTRFYMQPEHERTKESLKNITDEYLNIIQIMFKTIKEKNYMVVENLDRSIGENLAVFTARIFRHDRLLDFYKEKLSGRPHP